MLHLPLSVGQPFRGDYLEISKNPKYQKLSSAMDEKVLLADMVNKINRANGKVIPAPLSHEHGIPPEYSGDKGENTSPETI